ncbi:MAG: hypothetical protein FJ382_07600 [Verrucomicrobia bacterium]|nr:hypothetical protein [Verrucomicrobiota bacterium]
MTGPLQPRRHHLELCGRIRRLLEEERTFLETALAPLSSAPALTQQREALVRELHASVEALRQWTPTEAGLDPRANPEYIQLVSSARSETLEVIQLQATVESLMVRHSLRRPKMAAPAEIPAPALAARASLRSLPPENPH